MRLPTPKEVLAAGLGLLLFFAFLGMFSWLASKLPKYETTDTETESWGVGGKTR